MDESAVSDTIIGEWQNRLRRLITRYEAYRGRTRRFWRYLFVLFFLLNCVSYQFALMTAFPERAFGVDWLRYVLIMFPIGLFGAAFDGASFLVTLAIMRHAVRIRARLVYLGHVAADIVIAVLATGWVLIVFSVSTVLVDFVIGPPEAVPVATPARQAKAPAPAVKSPAASTPKPTVTAPPPPKTVTPPKPAIAPVAAPGDGSLDHGRFMTARAQGYRDRVASALDDPFSSQNLKNIYFGAVMGVSAMLPSLVHLYLGIAALIAVGAGSGRRRADADDAER